MDGVVFAVYAVPTTPALAFGVVEITTNVAKYAARLSRSICGKALLLAIEVWLLLPLAMAFGLLTALLIAVVIRAELFAAFRT
jgi:hypothetical protein